MSAAAHSFRFLDGLGRPGKGFNKICSQSNSIFFVRRLSHSFSSEGSVLSHDAEAYSTHFPATFSGK